jgi:hypothetical protein
MDINRVETKQEIAARWRREGKRFSLSDVDEEFQRQCDWSQRLLEEHILAEQPGSEAAAQTRDHRRAGHWTTHRREPAAWGPTI